MKKPQRARPEEREVKVAILTRLGYRVSCTGKRYSSLYHRRMVAVLGDIDTLRPQLWLEALRQGIRTAGCVVALCDGGRGFWRLYHECFANCAGAQALRAAQFAILDFYHAAQNLWKAAATALDGRTIKARQWFKLVRHHARSGESEQVIAQLAHAIEWSQFPKSVVNTLTNVHDYLHTPK